MIGKVVFKSNITESPVFSENKIFCNEKIAIYLDRSDLLVWAIYICFENKLCYLPFDTDYPQERLNDIIKNIKLNTFVTSSQYVDLFPRDARIIVIDNYSDLKKLNDLYGDSEIAYILHTSGTTGKAKGVEIYRDSLFNLIEGISDIINFIPEKRIANFTTVSFDIFFLESVMSLLKGLTVIVADYNEQHNPKLMAKFIIENKIDMIQMTPSMMQLLLNYDKKLICLQDVKEIMIGGEQFPDKLLKLLQSATNAKIYNMYGPTETTVWSCISDLTNAKKVDIGEPIKEIKIYILDDKRNPLPVGEIGEIGIAGKGLAKGYYNNDILTQERFVYLSKEPNIRVYLTGDIGKCLADGSIEYIGRNDNQIKLNGHRIELEEIENVLMKYGSITQAVVVLAEKGENRFLTAFYTCEKEISENELKRYLNPILPYYMVPSQFILLSSLPYTQNGKVNRRAILEIYQLNSCTAKDSMKIQSSFDEKLLSIVLNNAGNINFEVTTETALSVLSLDSISFIKMVVSLEQEYDFEFDDEKLLFTAFRTVGELSDYVQSKCDPN